MKVLLDTHVLLWALADDGKLTTDHRRLIEDGMNDVFVSSISVAEIAIKSSLGKVEVPSDLLQVIATQAYEELPFSAQHALELRDLPFHHRDPFDRMLISQARAENLSLLTVDERMRQYDVKLA